MAEETTKGNAFENVEQHARSLRKVLGTVREEQADRDDLIVDIRNAERGRLEALREELEPLIADIDPNDDRFDFIIGGRERPRLWIDMTTFVAVGQDRQTFRLLKDTRMGRMVLAETGDTVTMGDEVSRYIAERIIERERMIEGEWFEMKRDAVLNAARSARPDPSPSSVSQHQPAMAAAMPQDAPPARSTAAPRQPVQAPKKVRRNGLMPSIFGFLTGVTLTVCAALLAAWALLPEVFAQIVAALGLS